MGNMISLMTEKEAKEALEQAKTSLSEFRRIVVEIVTRQGYVHFGYDNPKDFIIGEFNSESSYASRQLVQMRVALMVSDDGSIDPDLKVSHTAACGKVINTLNVPSAESDSVRAMIIRTARAVAMQEGRATISASDIRAVGDVLIDIQGGNGGESGYVQGADGKNYNILKITKTSPKKASKIFANAIIAARDERSQRQRDIVASHYKKLSARVSDIKRDGDYIVAVLQIANGSDIASVKIGDNVSITVKQTSKIHLANRQVRKAVAI